MADWGTIALVALVLGFLPAAIIAFIIVKIIAIIALVIAFFWLLTQPPYAWLFVLSLAFNVVLLVPLWVVSWMAATYEPELWRAAELHVYVFSGVFVLPTAFFYLLWDLKPPEPKEEPEEET